MRIGVSEVNITPDCAVELSGFAARVQPSTGVLDPIFAKALYVQHAGEQVLWLGADVVAFAPDFCQSFRRWCGDALGLRNVLLSATHTHSAPATVDLTGCGRPSESCLRWLRQRMEDAARAALANVQECSVCAVQERLELAIDRRGKPSAHIDPMVTAVGFRCVDGAFHAVAVNYAMHPVALGAVNRAISGDWCSATAAATQREMPGKPITLISNGAAGNINPPRTDVPHDQMRRWGQAVANAVVAPLLAAEPISHDVFGVAREVVPIELDALPADEIDRIVDANLGKFAGHAWSKSWDAANQAWRISQKQRICSGLDQTHDFELFVVKLGPVFLVAVNGEMFSRFTEMVRQATGKRLFTVAYANAAFGYMPTRQAYAEGGYEVDTAHFFYNSFRPKPGALELLADRAASLVTKLAND